MGLSELMSKSTFITAILFLEIFSSVLCVKGKHFPIIYLTFVHTNVWERVKIIDFIVGLTAVYCNCNKINRVHFFGKLNETEYNF